MNEAQQIIFVIRKPPVRQVNRTAQKDNKNDEYFEKMIIHIPN